MNRVLVIDKPKGMTSHDVVARVRRQTRIKKVGHAGTLDPAATGVLVVFVGKATRLAQFFVDLDKRYHGRVVLGISTDSQDATGKVESTADASKITRKQIDEAFAAFEGDTEQVPPMVSALKRDGTPLYVLARRGEVVERKARPITVSDLSVVAVELPEVEFDMRCSKGTYVRTIAADIGEALGCGAHLGQLSRTAVGPFTLDMAMQLNELTRDGMEAGEFGYSMHDALSFMPEIRITDVEEDRIATGGAIEVDRERLGANLGTHYRLSVNGLELAAVGKLTEAGARESGSEDQPAGDVLSGAGEGGPVRIQPVRVFTELD